MHTGRLLLTLASFFFSFMLPSFAQQPESATDLTRVGVGSRPPDFMLKDLDGQSHSLKQYEKKKNVVLVFYRGHW